MQKLIKCWADVRSDDSTRHVPQTDAAQLTQLARSALEGNCNDEGRIGRNSCAVELWLWL